MNLLRRVAKWLEDKQIFQRERKSDEKRARGMLLYNAGLSYKKSGIRCKRVVTTLNKP